MLLGLSILGIVAGVLSFLVWQAHRASPPPARRDDGVIDWTRQWRRALDSLDRPLPSQRRPSGPTPVPPRTPAPPLHSVRR